MGNLPKTVTLVEVGPRDGLQNEPKTIPTELKIQFINALSDTGLSVIESTSFVSPKWVPQMADHSDVMHNIQHKKHVRYPALVPNLKGLDAAIKAGVTDIAVFTAASETFSQKNTNCSINESLQRIEEVIKDAKKNKINVRGYVSCVLGCPYEGDIKIKKVTEVATTLFDLGCYEISLGDTIGVGTPNKAKHLIETVAKEIPTEKLAVHFHDTYGQALVNIYAALECGVNIIDCSVGGLGGCPYAPGAGGNVATEDVLYMLNGLNIKTGVDLTKLINAGKLISDFLQRPSRSKVALAYQ
jgi:hydroxymethylglutaryl-CoA lyase